LSQILVPQLLSNRPNSWLILIQWTASDHWPNICVQPPKSAGKFRTGRLFTASGSVFLNSPKVLRRQVTVSGNGDLAGFSREAVDLTARIPRRTEEREPSGK
jgi:hypothetical protein